MLPTNDCQGVDVPPPPICGGGTLRGASIRACFRCAPQHHALDFLKTQIMLLVEKLTDRIIGLAIEVHRNTGPGLLGSVDEQYLCRELEEAGIAFVRQVAVPIACQGIAVGNAFKADIVIVHEIILAIKAVTTIRPIYEGQLRAYLPISSIHVGLLLKSNVPVWPTASVAT
jgi:GxxExxY protein